MVRLHGYSDAFKVFNMYFLVLINMLREDYMGQIFVCTCSILLENKIVTIISHDKRQLK